MARFQVTTVRKLEIKFKSTCNSIEDWEEKEEKEEEEEKKRRDYSSRKTLNPIKYPRRAKEKPKYISSPHPNQKASWRIRRRSSEAQEALQQNLLQGISSCNNLITRVCLLVASYLTFLCVRFLVSLWNQVRFLVSLWNQKGLSCEPFVKQLYCIQGWI